ncbi:MAG: hypothetical protein ACHRXM_19680 [Isosphaerales bacterium]
MSLNWALVGPGLQSIFSTLQSSVNDHFLNPTSGYSLPLVGTQLGQPNDPVGQVFATLAQGISSAFQQNPPVQGQQPQDVVVSDLNTALASYQPQVTNTSLSTSQATFAVQASTTTPTTLTESVALELGLPGLASLAVTTRSVVTAQLTFKIELYFGLDKTGVFVDPTQNSANNPLLQVGLKANLSGFTGAAATLNGVPVEVTDNAQAPSSLDVPVTFNCSATSLIYDFAESNIDQINFDNSAVGNVNLAYALDVADAPALTMDLSVNWPLNSVTSNVSPFDALSDGEVPSVTFDAGVDLNSLSNELNAASSPLIQELDKEIKPLQDVVNFFYQPLPVLSNLGITVTPRTLLQDFLPINDQGFLSLLDTLHDFVDGTGSFSFPQGGEFNFAGSTLASSVDTRTNINFSALLSSIETQAQQDSQTVNTIQTFLDELGADLDGTVVLPVLTDPALAFDAILSNDNVALFQYTLNPINLPKLANIDLGPAIGPIIPPIPLFLQLTASFGLSAGLTLGYDTYGFHNAADDPIDGLFIANVSAQLIGSIGLTGELDLGLVQAGANGSLGLSFGVTGINTTGPNTHTVDTVDQKNKPLSETVLQLDDFTNDTVSGGPFCPFTVGGSADLSLSAFVQVGVSPFDLNYSYPLGSITLFDFSCPSCQPTATPQLAELFDNPDPSNPPIPGLPVADIEQQLPSTTRVLVLDMGDFASRRQNVNSTGATDEDFDISLPTDQKGIADKALLVSAFGAVEEIPGADTAGTTIIALEDSGSTPETVTVDQGVAASAYCIGGPHGNDFQYMGTGNTYMKGGTWDVSQGNPGQLKKPIQTLNTLQGGFGQNTLIGGDLSAKGYDAEKQAAWNMLIANPAEVLGAGQDGGQDDLLQAGNAGATMKGGGFGNDNFDGSDDSLAQSDPNSVDPSMPSQYVMIAGKNDKELGGDSMLAGYGQTDFQWQEGAGPLSVSGYTTLCQLDVLGDQAGETWTLSSANTDIPSVLISGEDKDQQSVGQIQESNVPTISVDADDQANSGGETYVINDLSTVTVTQVNVNLHEYTTAPDANGDHVIVNGPAGDDIVSLGVQQVATGQYGSNGQPIYQQQWTTTAITTTYGPNRTTVTYDIDAPLPKSSDSLDVNTFAGADSVTVTDTQPAATTVSTGGGKDTINVGGPSSALDDIQGPLLLDAGAGSNQITFDDAASTVGDILTLTSSLAPDHSGQGTSTPQGYLLRYVGQIVNLYGQGPSYRYPMTVTFQATGGDFSGGVSLTGTYSFDPAHFDQIYVESVLPNAPTTVRTNGEDDQIYVGFDGGPNGATSDPTSTLDYLAATLDVIDESGPSTGLTVDDEGSPRSDTYRVTASDVARVNEPAEIQYQSIGQLLLKAATAEDNTIDVLGTESGTTTTVDAGDGNNGITVSDSSQKLDEVLGPLTVNGGTGQDSLAIDDSGNGQGQTYELTATQLERVGPPVIQINFNAISSLAFDASESGFTNDILVTGTPSGVPVTVQTGQGLADLGAISFDDIQGPLTFQWSRGFDSFVGLDTDAGESASYQVLPDRITRTGAATIQFDDAGDPLTSIYLAAGGLNPAEIDVPRTINATAVTVLAGDAADQVLVSNLQEDLDTIQGPLTIQGTASTVARLLDQNGPQGRSYTMDARSLTFNGSLPAIAFKSLGALDLETGSDSQTAVHATAAGTAMTLDLGQGANTVVAGSVKEQLDTIAGPLTVKGQSGQDVLTLLDDGTTSSKVTYTLNSNSVEWSSSSSSGSVDYSHLKTVALEGSVDSATYDLQSAASNTQFQVVAHGIDNSLDGISSLIGVADEVWSITDIDTGSLFGNVGFTDIQNLHGAAGTDVFAFGPAAMITGKISGGGGSDWLDYSAYNHPVAVNLAKGTATAVNGGIDGIENVRGTAFGNNLVGDSHGNVLVGGAGIDVIKGGSGHSILIGDQGKDSITASAGGSILIGGVTNHDASGLANDLALDSILAEWQSTKSYSTRIKDITKGVGPNGSFRLVWKATVNDDRNANKLTGGAGRDWFFKGAKDKLINKKPGERVN